MRSHVILLDGTLSNLKFERETSIGLIYKLLKPGNHELTVYYRPGLQWGNWKSNLAVLTGQGLSNQIKEAYGALASRYEYGDNIFFFGYSRGAFSVRAISGMINEVGLLKKKYSTERNVSNVWRLYHKRKVNQHFSKHLCHANVDIQFIGVLDTVAPLGLSIPLVRKYFERYYKFYNNSVCPNVKNAFHALSIDEARAAYSPEYWDLGNIPENTKAKQVWFRGVHGDIGGQIGDVKSARQLSNIPLVWLLDNAVRSGLSLPSDWKLNFPTNPKAISSKRFSWINIFSLFNTKRRINLSKHEWIHESVSNTYAK